MADLTPGMTGSRNPHQRWRTTLTSTCILVSWLALLPAGEAAPSGQGESQHVGIMKTHHERSYPQNILGWDEGIKTIRAGKHKAYMIFIGRAGSAVLRKLNSEGLHLVDGTIAIIHLSANSEVTNPFSNRLVSGRDMIMNLTGPLHELTGGACVFLDANGNLLPQFTIIQSLHRNRLEVIDLYCRHVASPLRDKQTLAEFARYEGLPIGQTLVMEVNAKAHMDFKWMFREVTEQEPYPKGVDAQGEVHDPRIDPAISVVTRDANGPVFIAQVRELWEKLGVATERGTQRPPLMIYGPVNAVYPSLDALGIKYGTASLTAEQLNRFNSPTVILPGGQPGQGRKTIEVRGFTLGQTIGEILLPNESHGLLTNKVVLHPDIPVGDIDSERGE